MDISLEMAELLTSQRIVILRMLREERHASEIAERMGVSRQAVDKHLSLLYRFGLVDKRVKEGVRPMVFYRITSEGEEALQSFEDMASELVLALRKRYRSELINLDRMLVDGEITEREYRERRRSLDRRFRWVMEDEDQKRR